MKRAGLVPDGSTNNYNRHFYLYAKYHYHQGNLLEDLKRLLANYCGINVEQLSTKDVIEKLISLIYPHLNEYKFRELILLVVLGDPYQLKGTPDTDTLYSFIHKSLSVLRFVETKDIPFDLGEPDCNVLPLAKDDN